MKTYFEDLNEILEILVKLVRGKLNPLLRKTISVLIIIEVHG